MTTNKFHLEDSLRTVHNQVTSGMNIINDDYIEHRYEQRGSEYTLRSWRDREVTITHSIHARPDWLTKIIDIAVVGGHVQSIPNPPPDLIVWFRTAKGSDDLLGFVNFTDPK